MLEEGHWDVYMSGALSALSSDELSYVTNEIYDRVAKACAGLGLRCYLPHKSETTPTKGMPHGKVWQIDYKRVVNSGAVVAYIGKPSLGVGAEVEMARTANVPVILLFEISSQEGLSRLVLGNPAVRYTVPFDKPEEIEAQVQTYLTVIFSERNLDSIAYSEEWPFRKRQELRKQLVIVEEAVNKGTKYRKFPEKPISIEAWRELGNEWDKKGETSNLDDYGKPN